MQRDVQGSASSAGERAAGTGAVAAAALIGALLVLVAQFVALYYVRIATSSNPIKTVGTGPNHGWAPLPIALVCLALVLAVYRYGNRAALLGLCVLGVATLVIALAVDLPDVHATGLVGSSAGQFERAANSAAPGLYLETLGSVLLLVSGGIGLLMVGGATVQIARPAIGRRPRSATESPARAGADAAVRAGADAPVRAGADAPVRARADAPAPGATEPAVPSPEAPADEPAGADGTPPAAKGPLSLGDSKRRRWSAS